MPTNWSLIEGLKPAWDCFITKIYPEFIQMDAQKMCPPPQKVLRALQETDMEQIKVVVLGMDPYHNGAATGLCFHVEEGAKIPGSLRNIQSKIYEETGQKGDLASWPGQNVLMLNTALTTQRGVAGANMKLWEPFTEEVLRYLDTQDDIVWLLWGANARDIVKRIIKNPTHRFIISSHPSPLSYHKPLGKYPAFKDSVPFGKANKILAEKGKTPIQW